MLDPFLNYKKLIFYSINTTSTKYKLQPQVSQDVREKGSFIHKKVRSRP